LILLKAYERGQRKQRQIESTLLTSEGATWQLLKYDPSPDDGPKNLASVLGPMQLESGIRQSVQLCWMSLPAGKRNIDEVERQIRRITDRIFKNLREDEAALSGE
jgi:hypothetical protein